MKQCAKKLEGRHNFKAFMSSGGQAKTFERIIYYIDIKQKDNEIEFASYVKKHYNKKNKNKFI